MLKSPNRMKLRAQARLSWERLLMNSAILPISSTRRGSLASLLPAIQAPTLLIWGDEDRETPLAQGQLMAQAIPGARLEVFPGAGHYSYLDQPTAFCALVRSFLS